MSIFKRLGGWAKRRATEGSTLLGVATILASLIAPKLGIPIDQTAELIAIGLGGVLMGATSSNHQTLTERREDGP